MCNILFLPAGVPIKETSIANMTLNNPDGLGLLIKDTDGKVLQVAREFYPEGTDPNRVIHLLKKYKQHDRLLHVRYNTVGTSSLENVHPFEVYKSDDRTVYMMHNGTLYDFKPANAAKSDSRFFSETFLSPLLNHHSNDGNYFHGVFPRVIDKFTATGSKVVLWGSGLEPLFIGPWTHEKNTDGSFHYSTSNTDYFDRVNPSRSVQARRAGTTSNFSVGYQNIGARNSGSGTVWNSALRGFEEPKARFISEETEVGKSAESFFPQGQRVLPLLPRSSENDLRDRRATMVKAGTTVPFKFKTPLSDIDLKRKNLVEMITEELVVLSKSLDMDASVLFSTEGYAMLMHITNDEWTEVAKKHPEAIGNLMTILAYGCDDLEGAVLAEQTKSAKQQIMINKAAGLLAKHGVKLADAA